MIRLNKNRLINTLFLPIFLLISFSMAFAAQKGECSKEEALVPILVKKILSGPFTCPFFRADVLSQISKKTPDELKSIYFHLKSQLIKSVSCEKKESTSILDTSSPKYLEEMFKDCNLIGIPILKNALLSPQAQINITPIEGTFDYERDYAQCIDQDDKVKKIVFFILQKASKKEDTVKISCIKHEYSIASLFKRNLPLKIVTYPLTLACKPRLPSWVQNKFDIRNTILNLLSPGNQEDIQTVYKCSQKEIIQLKLREHSDNIVPYTQHVCKQCKPFFKSSKKLLSGSSWSAGLNPFLLQGKIPEHVHLKIKSNNTTTGWNLRRTLPIEWNAHK